MRVPSAVLLARMLARTRLRQWQLVEQIAMLGSVQRAADAVGMSQPAATHALGELERLLGFAIFERHARGARPTPAGDAVLPRVQIAMRAFADCAEAVSDLLSGSAGELRVGAIGAALGGLLSDAVAAFTISHPAVALHVEQMSPEPLLLALQGGMIDLALARRPPQLPAEATFEALLADRYAIVCSPRHPLAGCAGVTPAELARHLWMTPPKATITERDFDGLWAGVEPPQHLCWVESRSPQLMWAIVEQRQALVLIPYNTVRPWLRSRVLAEVPGRWGPPIEPLGVLLPAPALDDGGPIGAFVEALRAAAASARD